MKLTSDILKKQLRYQGKQYGSGVRGGDTSPHMLTQAADRIELLEGALNDLLNECINFDGTNFKVSRCYLEVASNALKG